MYWHRSSVSIEMGRCGSPDQHVEVVVVSSFSPGPARTAGIYRALIQSQVADSRGVSPGGKLGTE